MLINQEDSTVISDLCCACRSVAVRMEDYEVYYRKQKADSNCGFAEEFEVELWLKPQFSKIQSMTNICSIAILFFIPFFFNFSKDLKPVGTDQPKTVASFLENKPKNRYNNVLPCELSELLAAPQQQPSSFIACHAVSYHFHYISLLCHLRWFFKSETLNYPRQSVWWLHQC